jgi:hypothetical protein
VRVKRPGARASRRECFVCGTLTRKIKGQRMKDRLPPKLYAYRVSVKEANELWRHLIYKKAFNGRCAVCGRDRGLQAMHLFPKGKYPHMRFDLDNGAPGCAGCHMRLTNDHEAHRTFCIQYLGAERYEALRLRSLCKAKVDVTLVIVALRQLSSV